MAVFHTRQGRDIKLKGSARKEIVAKGLPDQVAIQPPDFKGANLRVLVEAGDKVQVGSVLFEDKTNEAMKIVSPASGEVQAINRGAKRALMHVVINTDGQQNAVQHTVYSAEEIQQLSRDQITSHMLSTGLWPVLRQRPFSKIARPQDKPKSIFVHAMTTEPLGPDMDFILEGSLEDFQTGLDVLTKLTDGRVHLCLAKGAKSKALTQARNVDVHHFSGPHPAGNVSTHIHCVDPVLKGDLVWYVEAQDVARLGRLFSKGVYAPEVYVILTGEGVDTRHYAKTIIGASVKSLLDGQIKEGIRYISGSVLRGRNIGASGFIGYYDSQLTAIPEGGHRKLLGWLVPGFKSYSFSNTFASSFLPPKEVSLDADTNGSDRAIVLNHIYDSLVPLNIMVYFLLRAVISGDIEECEKLGILECDEEDFALCTFACPSKTDVGGIIRDGLEIIEKEG